MALTGQQKPSGNYSLLKAERGIIESTAVRTPEDDSPELLPREEASKNDTTLPAENVRLSEKLPLVKRRTRSFNRDASC